MYDITYCTRECENKFCDRNRKRYNEMTYQNHFVWLSDFEDCKDYRKPKEEKFVYIGDENE